MSYDVRLKEAATWLSQIQNSDGGFGVVPGQTSSIVNTVEAAFILNRAGPIEAQCKALSFIQETFRIHLDSHGPRTRYAAFTLFALSDAGLVDSDPLVQSCISLLEEYQNDNGSWPGEQGQANDCLLSTFHANWALRKARYSGQALEKSCQWFLSQAKDWGWALNSDRIASPVAISYAVIALHNYKDANERVQSATKSLLEISNFPSFEESVVSGSTWKHSTYPWVISAMLLSGENPYCPTIAGQVRDINRLRHEKSGWLEPGDAKEPTVRGQFWAAYALSSIRSFYEPEIHTLRIDAVSAENMHKEPDFVKLCVRSPWAVVIPALFYKLTAYFFLLLTLLFLSGVHEEIELPVWTDRVLVLICAVMFYIIVSKRSSLFPKMKVGMKWFIIVMSTMNIFFGITFISVVSFFKNKIMQLLM